MHTGKKILLVEDSRFITAVVGDYLKKNGFEIDSVATGEDAVEIVCGHSAWDLILMDIELAGEMNGIEAAKIINNHKELPIIFLTANASDTIINQIRNISAYGFIEKGMDNTALLATIEMALKLHDVKSEIKQKESILNAVINSVQDGMIMTDDKGYVSLWNPAAVQLFGYTKDEMLGKELHELTAAESMNKNDIINSLFADKKVKELKIKHKNGQVFDAEISTSTLKINDKDYFVGIFRDISDRIKAREELEKLSVTDYLTNTYNRRFFVTRLEEEIERSKRTGRVFSIAMLDIDRFKTINDKYGHSIGDLVLQSITGYIKKRIRKVDCLARWGGEEFMILLADTPIINSGVLLEDLRLGISKIEIPNVDRFTGSFGVVEYAPGDTADMMIQKADSMMYEAKKCGRNCIKYMM
ncbi:diguanylate cyclase [Sedimentibacter hydroxybenzoicus DSM 7310]|uniref:Diguanylate cyclase n=1 Tax=Sedimentibacter hydroxybenzoicus DSM 7310 TaxID=1123245 RepID=A0A974GXR5_SEDHY|nr:diguanylate cyclase [Sedimentibacter hydroxybenzoicus]NYB75340.1 diguanylate cyclase [Sedimentibacter hydroxybenzoicus DSM 7310]